MKVHIGSEIKKVVDQKPWSIVHFAKEAGMSYRKALYLFERTDISIDELLRISKVLDHDFLQLFHTTTVAKSNAQENVVKTHKKEFITMNFSLLIGGNQSLYDKFPEFLKKTRQIAEELGFELL